MSKPAAPTTRKLKTQKSEGLWIYSFADLALILMSCFALMIAMSKPASTKFEEVVEKISNQKSGGDGLSATEKKVSQEIKKQKLDGAVVVEQDQEGIAVEFKDSLIFSPGSADLSEQQASTIKSILDSLIKANPKYKITIEGHTDDTPLGSHGKFRSNWDLSGARGISILHQLVKQGVDRNRIRVISYADTRPKVAVQNKSGADLATARAANRRVVIRLD